MIRSVRPKSVPANFTGAHPAEPRRLLAQMSKTAGSIGSSLTSPKLHSATFKHTSDFVLQPRGQNELWSSRPSSLSLDSGSFWAAKKKLFQKPFSICQLIFLYVVVVSVNRIKLPFEECLPQLHSCSGCSSCNSCVPGKRKSQGSVLKNPYPSIMVLSLDCKYPRTSPKRLIEWFLIGCRKTKTKAIILANHQRLRQFREPIRIWSNYM